MAMHSKLGRDARLDLAGPCDETVLLALAHVHGYRGYRSASVLATPWIAIPDRTPGVDEGLSL